MAAMIPCPTEGPESWLIWKNSGSPGSIGSPGIWLSIGWLVRLIAPVRVAIASSVRRGSTSDPNQPPTGGGGSGIGGLSGGGLGGDGGLGGLGGGGGLDPLPDPDPEPLPDPDPEPLPEP